MILTTQRGSGAPPLVPTFYGFVPSSKDALILFEACLEGRLQFLQRRPLNRERSQLIKSGSVFIYSEKASGIKRWTDRIAWSPSRMLENFLIYRELEKSDPRGNKRRAFKRKRHTVPDEPHTCSASGGNVGSDRITPTIYPTTTTNTSTNMLLVVSSKTDKHSQRSLTGSLVENYGFRADGLVKKTMSIASKDGPLHMVSYYKVDEVKNNELPLPKFDPRLQSISVRPELYLKQNFRLPVEGTELCDTNGNRYKRPQIPYSVLEGPYETHPGGWFREQQNQPAYATPVPVPSPVFNFPGPHLSMQLGAAPVSLGSDPGYNAQSYGNYYISQRQAGKAGGRHTSPKPTPYAYQHEQSCSQMQRDSTQSTSLMTPSAYRALSEQSLSAFKPTSTRPPYSSTTTTPQVHQSQILLDTSRTIVCYPIEGRSLLDAERSKFA